MENNNAFPIPTDRMPGGPYCGLTKRELFAAMAMQGLLSDVETQRQMQQDPRYNKKNFNEVVAMNAIEFADALLKHLESNPLT